MPAYSSCRRRSSEQRSDVVQQYWCCPVLLTIIVKIGSSLCSAVMNMSLMTLLLSLPDSCQRISF